MKELKERTPKDERGRRKHHYHMLLTEDIGHPHLSNQITARLRCAAIFPQTLKLHP